MREVTYYRLAATLPVVIPFIAHLFYRDDPAIGLLDRVTIPLYVSGIAWPAYIPFAAVLFWWLRRSRWSGIGGCRGSRRSCSFRRSCSTSSWCDGGRRAPSLAGSAHLLLDRGARCSGTPMCC